MRRWVVCNYLPIGTLILKPRRHCLHIWELNEDETAELGPLLKKTSGVISEIVDADQVYCLLWSHMNGKPGHIHFVLQPALNEDWGQDVKWPKPDPALVAPVAGQVSPPV